MKNYLERLDRQLQGILREASIIADKDRIPAYLVGGCVRDLMLGEGNLDLDIVVSGDGIKFSEDLGNALGAGLTLHKRFGTATLELSSSLKVDIATSRSEFYPSAASLPIVQKGTLKEDMARRDFTINAIAISINKDTFGELVDFFGGCRDLEDRKIRALHALSFIDDPTRILRAVRFEQRYSFKMEPGTLGFLKAAKKERMLERIQPQRLREELIILLKEKNPLKNIKRLKALYGFDFLTPGLSSLPGNYTLLEKTREEISWFEKKFPSYRKLDSWLIYFMALLDRSSTSQAKAVCRRFVFRKGDEKRIISFKKMRKDFALELKARSILPDRIFSLLRPLSFEAIILLRAKHNDKNLRKHIAEFLEVYNDMKLCVSGSDLCRIGIKPGPHYRKLFDRVLSAKLNGLVKTHEEEMEMIKKLVARR